MNSKKILTWYQQLPFAFLTLALFLFLYQQLVQFNIFQDGMLYACLSMNMAHGMGSLWQPAFTPAFWPHFYEHPPLAFWLQSWAFHLLGDAWFADRIYTLFTILLLLSALIIIQRKLTGYALYLVIIFCWLINLGDINTYVHNYIECTFCVFTTFAVVFILLALQGQVRTRAFSFLIVASALMSAAFFYQWRASIFPSGNAFYLLLRIAYYPLANRAFIYTHLNTGYWHFGGADIILSACVSHDE